MKSILQRCLSKAVTFILINGKEKRIQLQQISVFVVPKSLILHSFKSCKEFPIQAIPFIKTWRFA